jgi:hypothetical protein
MAAAAAILITGSLTFATANRHATVAQVTATAAAPAAPISTPAVSRVAVAPAAPAAVVAISQASARKPAGLSLTGGVQDLSDDQLESLVNGLDNVEALPSGEPEPLTISVDEDGLQ